MSDLLIKDVELPKRKDGDILTNEEHLTLRILPNGRVYRCICNEDFLGFTIKSTEPIGKVEVINRVSTEEQ